ncbi:MAG: MOSC domain-containing protein [Actinomycetota bacterium]
MIVGRVADLWWYPVKSFLGQRAEQLAVTPEGIPGDRRIALADAETGRVLSAKRVHRLLDGRTEGDRMVLPSGHVLSAEDPGAEDVLSGWLGRRVVIVRAPGGEIRSEIEGEEDTVFRGQPGGLHDDSPIHLVTTSTLEHLTSLYPAGTFDARRFRPNIVVATGDVRGPLEQLWIGRSLRIGDAELTVTKTCHRCVITTLPQSELPNDPGILRTVNTMTDRETGVYLRAASAGRISVGDEVAIG